MADYIYGKNSVLSVLKADPKRIFKIFIVEGHKPDRRLHDILALAKNAGITVQHAQRQKLESLLQDQETEGPTIHQGIIASVAPKKLLDLQTLIEQSTPLVEAGHYPLFLMLDGVTDPRNFGAILRVADAGGVNGVIIAKRDSAGFSPAVSKTASGAEASIDVSVVSNLAQALKKLKDQGFWIVGTVQETDATPYYNQDYRMPTVLILGGEGEGISPLLFKACDFKVTIPMRGAVESLNVSTAAAILIFDIQSPRRTAKK